MVTGVTFFNNTGNPTGSSGKRKGVQQYAQKSEKKKGAGSGVQLFSHLDKLVDSVSTKSECISSGLDKIGCSI